MIHLHVHTDKSQLDGMCDAGRLVKRVKELGMNAVGVSNHGNMIDALTFQEECIKEDIKPILGCEFYIGEENEKDNYHILCIAKNNIGLKNLYKLNTFSYIKNFYRKPRITFDKLLEHKEGLIVTTACIGSEFGQKFLNKTSIFEFEDFVKKYKNAFGEDFYLEIQPNSIPAQKEYNKMLVNIANLTGVPLVVTTDAHYVTKEDAEIHDTMLAMQVKKKKTDTDRFKFTGTDYYIKTDSEILSDLPYLEPSVVMEAIRNTQNIANKCNAKIETGLNLLPKMPGVTDADLELAKHCNEGFTRRVKEGMPCTKEYISRVKYELDIIKQKGYSGYFLIVEDYISWSRKNNIMVGAGRGSGAGSLVCYILGITNVDPIKHGLLFERFLNPERNTSPDIDSDFSYHRRNEVLQYVKDKYGNDNVAHIIAIGTMSCNAVCRKVLSTCGYEMPYVNKICKTIPKDLGITLQEAYDKSEEFKAYMNKHSKEYTTMIRLEGLMSHAGKHAAGVIISSEQIDNHIPCMRDEDDTTMLKTQWDKHMVENVGAYKFDFLALKTLSILENTIKNIKKNYNVDIDLDKIDLNDKIIYEVLNSGDLEGIFQFCEPSGKQIIERIKPTVFEDIVAGNALCRPGVKERELYLKNKEIWNEKKNEFNVDNKADAIIDSILKETYGAIVYQEQTMLLMNQLTGGRWTLGKTDKMRKVKNLEEYRKDFVDCCNANSIDSNVSNSIFDRFDLGYSFNKSHACCYAVIACQTAYLKGKYRKEFMSAVMSMEMLNTSDNNLPQQIKECKKYGIEVLPPDINKSDKVFVPTEDGINYPISAIMNVGEVAVENILKLKPFSSFEDFIEKVPKSKVNKKVVTNLIKAGAFDKIYGTNRNILLEKYLDKKQMTWCREQKIVHEREVLGTTLTEHPLDDYHTIPISELPEKAVTVGMIIQFKIIKDRNSNDMAFITFENKLETFEGICFASTYAKYKEIIYNNSKLMISGKKDKNKILINELRCV